MSIELKLGKKTYSVENPESLATCLEFVTLWSSSADVKLLRLCAGAIGIYLDKTALYPTYKPTKEEPIEYGRKMLERLLDDKIIASNIYEAGSICLKNMFYCIPTESEVEETANFTQ